MAGRVLGGGLDAQWALGVPTGETARRLLLTAASCAASVAVAPSLAGAGALAALALTLCCIFLFPAIGRVPSHVWGPVLGASTAVAASHLCVGLGARAHAIGGAVILGELLGHLQVPLLILTFAYLAVSLDDSGFFDWCSLQIMRVAHGDGRKLLLHLFAGVSVLTFFTSNDIVILSVTPILIHLGRNAGIRNLTPYLIAQFVAANSASMGLYIGNPTNIVIGDAVALDFLQYAERMLVPTTVATATALGMVWLIFGRASRRNRVPRTYLMPAVGEERCFTREMALKAVAFALCQVALGAASIWPARGASGAQSSTTMLVIGLVFAGALALYDSVRGRRGAVLLRQQVARLPFEIVPFFLSFCIILRGLEEAGLTRIAIDLVVAAFEHGPVVGSLASGFFGVAAVNLTNNIPATILFEKMWLGAPSGALALPGLGGRLGGLHSAYPDIFVDCALYASNFGANLSLIGALAGLMWFRLLRANLGDGHDTRGPTLREFTLYGVLIVPVVTVITCAAIGWSRMQPG